MLIVKNMIGAYDDVILHSENDTQLLNYQIIRCGHHVVKVRSVWERNTT